MNKPIRLFWNECYAPKPVVVEAIIKKAVDESLEKINLYPGELYDDVIEVVANDLGVDQNQVILGHGVEGLLHLLSRVYLSKTRIGGTFQPSFFAFDNNLSRSRSVKYPAHYKKEIDLNDFLQKIKGTKIFFLASPNKETGNYLLSAKQIKTVLENYKGIFVVDECYFGLGQVTVVDLVDKYPNLVVLRSVSKAEGLAGLRIGIAIAGVHIINKLKYFQNDIEYDPFSSVVLSILKDVYPHFPDIWKLTRGFFDDFYEQLKKKFPQNKIIKTVTTHHFFDVRAGGVESYKVIEKMNEAGYLLSPKTPRDSNSRYTVFPGMLALTPPPIEYWNEYFQVLKSALNTC